MARRIAALLLVLTFVPIVEVVERWLDVPEHTAHADGLSAEERSPLSPEHGCAALFHTCGCAGHVALVAPHPTVPRAERVLQVLAAWPTLSDRPPDAPPVPPPDA